MSKKVKLVARIDKDAKIYMKPEGTSGEECLGLMKFVDKIPGLYVEEMGHTDDMRGGCGVSAYDEVEE